MPDILGQTSQAQAGIRHMSRIFNSYPKNWGNSCSDPHIDILDGLDKICSLVFEKEKKMDLNEGANRIFGRAREKNMSRRTFFAKGGCAAGLTLLAFTGIDPKILAAQGTKSKEEILKELEAKAEKYMTMYRSCSQASFAALNEQFELKADHTIPALMPFAGGIVGKGETCGAVSGSVLAIGFYLDQKGKPQPLSSFAFGGSFFDGFEKEFGSTRCKEVIKHQFGRYYDFLDPEERELFMAESKKSGKCLEVVKKAVLIAGEIFLENI